MSTVHPIFDQRRRAGTIHLPEGAAKLIETGGWQAFGFASIVIACVADPLLLLLLSQQNLDPVAALVLKVRQSTLVDGSRVVVVYAAEA